jgi:hypothetical protein
MQKSRQKGDQSGDHDDFDGSAVEKNIDLGSEIGYLTHPAK